MPSHSEHYQKEGAAHAQEGTGASGLQFVPIPQDFRIFGLLKQAPKGADFSQTRKRNKLFAKSSSSSFRKSSRKESGASWQRGTDA
jgi:hypothetical protein